MAWCTFGLFLLFVPALVFFVSGGKYVSSTYGLDKTLMGNMGLGKLVFSSVNHFVAAHIICTSRCRASSRSWGHSPSESQRDWSVVEQHRPLCLRYLAVICAPTIGELSVITTFE